MITSNTSIPFIKSENSENKFYLSQLTSEYNEGDSITTSTAINCRKLAIAIKAGDKIRINGTSLTVFADAAVDATSFFVEAITLDEALNINANIAIDEDNMFVQYQRKTEGTVAGFDIDADGMSKGGVEITGWLNSDTMEGATENNIPTAESVKAYVDASSGGTTSTLQEVTDAGNTTTNSIMIGSSSSPSEKLEVDGNIKVGDNDEIKFGTDDDLKMYHNASDSYIENETGNLYIRNNGNDKDIILQSDDGSGGTTPYLTLDGGLGYTTVQKRMKFNDNTQLQFGSGGDFQLFHVSDQGYIDNSTGNLNIRQKADDKDIVFSCDDGSGGTTAYLTLDGSAGHTTVQKEMNFGDSVEATFGASNDLKVYHSGTHSYIVQRGTGNLYIQQTTNDKDITFTCDNGSGGNTTYLTLDGSQTTINLYQNVLIGTTTDNGYKLDVNGTQRVQSVLELDDVLTLNAISTPADPVDGKSSIYMDSADGDIKVKINLGGDVVTRTLASFSG
jgi:hypothetical protein